jgi:sulfur-oxidizing protein SoxA
MTGARALASLRRRFWPLLALCLMPGSGPAQDATMAHEVDGRASGWVYLSDDLRAMQDDDFQNPGMFAVDAGADLWATPAGKAGMSCASCHGDAAETMRGVAARYPVYDPQTGGLVNLELRINDERRRRMQADPLPYESEDLLALTAFLSYQSRGMPLDVAIDGPAAPFFDAGRDFFFRRRGQLDLSCAQCHDGLAGQKLRGDTISEGQVNGFPIYRLLWTSMGSRHRMFQWCNTNVRSEPYAYGSEEYLALELYLAWRSRGLPVETPAVRR